MTIDLDTDTWMLTDEQLTSAIVETFKTKARVEARCASLLATAQDRGLPRLAGCTSDTAWLAQLTGGVQG